MTDREKEDVSWNLFIKLALIFLGASLTLCLVGQLVRSLGHP